eukprot:1161428-Pelagomonas_calceolata.AAC.2
MRKEWFMEIRRVVVSTPIAGRVGLSSCAPPPLGGEKHGGLKGGSENEWHPETWEYKNTETRGDLCFDSSSFTLTVKCVILPARNLDLQDVFM